MVTIKDVAKLAGVAISTVSYALNDSPRISRATKKKVQTAARDLNYKKNGLAAALKSTKTNTIALLLSDLSGPFFSELIKGVQDIASANTYDLIACSSIGGAQSTAAKFLTEKRVDGAIILAENIDDDLAIRAAQQGFPLVVLDRILDNENIYMVEVDHREGGYRATEHLINHHHKNIAFINGPLSSHDAALRYQGYLKALKDYGLDYQSKWDINGDFTQESGYRSTRVLIAQRDLPTSIFYANDEMAFGGLQAFKESGIRVPQDISIIGYDDIERVKYTEPPLTTIRQPKYEAGTLAAHLVFQLLDKKETEHHFKLSTELIERQSVMDLQKQTL